MNRNIGPLWLVLTILAVVGVLVQMFSSRDTALGFEVSRDVSKRSLHHGAAIGNGSSKLVKRSMAPELRAGDPVIGDLYCKGSRFAEYMFMTEAQVMQPDALGSEGQAPFGRRDMTGKDMGWRKTHDDDQLDISHEPTAEHLAGLGGVESFPAHPILTTSDNIGRWVRTEWSQDSGYLPADSDDKNLQMPTNAYYDNIFSYEERVIMIMGARSPGYMSAVTMGYDDPRDAPKERRKMLPKIQRWSDVAYLEWCESASHRIAPAPSVKRKSPPPAWFLIEAVYGPPMTMASISYCLNHYGWKETRLPMWDERMTFPMGTYCYNVLLGTPNGLGLAMFLITHKYRFGETALGSVTIWGSLQTGPEGWEIPSMLWWASSATQKTVMREAWDANKKFEEEKPGNQDLMRYPWKLRPLPVPSS